MFFLGLAAATQQSVKLDIPPSQVIGPPTEQQLSLRMWVERFLVVAKLRIHRHSPIPNSPQVGHSTLSFWWPLSRQSVLFVSLV